MFDSIDTDRFRDQRVGVVYGGDSPERPVSLETGRALADALRSRDYRVEDYELPSDLSALVDDPPAAALLALHGGVGENGTLQGFLEMLEIPYTGSGVLGSALALDKARSKALFRDAGMMTPAFGTLEPERAREFEDAGDWLRRQDLEPPVVVKPSDGGSSQGVSICKSADDVADAVRTLGSEMTSTPAAGVVVEEYIDGPEFTVGLFDDTCLGALRVVPGEEFYDYEAKYESDETEYEIVEKPSLKQRLEAAGRMAFRTLGCRGVARADFVATERRGEQVLYALEVNTIPGMTETSLVPKLANHRGISFEEFAELMISAARLDSSSESHSSPVERT